jgi:hypothetical protein
MKKYLLYFLLFIFVPSCKGEKNNIDGDQDGTIRQPVYAGQFYAEDSVKLVKQIKFF